MPVTALAWTQRRVKFSAACAIPSPVAARPMSSSRLRSPVVSALSTFYQDSDDIHDEEQVHLSIVRLIAKLPTIASYAYKKSIGQPFLYPNNELDLIENFLTMMFAANVETIGSSGVK